MPTIFLLYIAIVVAFFLLGLILGYIINPGRKPKKQKEKPLSETVKEAPEDVQNLGQDSGGTEEDPLTGSYPSEQRYGYYSYNNYGNSYYGNNGRNRNAPR